MVTVHSMPGRRPQHQSCFIAPLPKSLSPFTFGTCLTQRRPRTSPIPFRARTTPHCAANNSRPFASRAASVGLNLLIRSLVLVDGDLDVDVNASTNLDLLSGRLKGISIKAERIVAEGLPISGGCALYVDALTLPQTAPFAVSVNATLTSADLNAKKIVGVFSDLMNSLLTNSVAGFVSAALGTDKARLVSIGVESEAPRSGLKSRLDTGGGRLRLEGRLRLRDGSEIEFVVRTALAVSRGGEFLELARPELSWRGRRVPLIPLARVGAALETGSSITALALSVDGLFVEGITVVVPPEVSGRGGVGGGTGRVSGRGTRPLLGGR